MLNYVILQVIQEMYCPFIHTQTEGWVLGHHHKPAAQAQDVQQHSRFCLSWLGALWKC